MFLSYLILLIVILPLVFPLVFKNRLRRCHSYHPHGAYIESKTTTQIGLSTIPVFDPELVEMILDNKIPESYRINIFSNYLNQKALEVELAKKDAELARNKAIKDAELAMKIAELASEKFIKDVELARDKAIKDAELAKKEAELAKKEAELARDKAIKDAELARKDVELAREIARKDVLIERLEKQHYLTLLEKMNSQTSMMAPRAVLEFVETFIMPSYNISTGLGREDKWTAFLGNTPVGKDIASCISKEIPLWGNNAKAIAGHLKSIYQFSCDYHHETSLEIRETSSITINKNQMLSQAFSVITCIAAACNLKITN